MAWASSFYYAPGKSYHSMANKFSCRHGNDINIWAVTNDACQGEAEERPLLPYSIDRLFSVKFAFVAWYLRVPESGSWCIERRPGSLGNQNQQREQIHLFFPALANNRLCALQWPLRLVPLPLIHSANYLFSGQVPLDERCSSRWAASPFSGCALSSKCSIYNLSFYTGIWCLRSRIGSALRPQTNRIRVKIPAVAIFKVRFIFHFLQLPPRNCLALWAHRMHQGGRNSRTLWIDWKGKISLFRLNIRTARLIMKLGGVMKTGRQ